MFGWWRGTRELRAETDRLRAEIARLSGAVDASQSATTQDAAAYQAFFDHVPVGCHELDAEGRVIRVNQAELDLLGFERHEMIGRHVWDFVSEPDVSQEAVLAKLAGTRPPGRRMERTFYRKNGAPVPVMIDDHLLIGSDGRVAGIRTSVVDLTERRLAEQSSEQLSMMVAQLEEQNRQNTVLNEMREFLLACVTTDEVAPVVTRALLALFPDCGGGLYLSTPAKTDLEMVARWGEAATSLASDHLFSIDECWGLRKGGAHLVDEIATGLVCPHVAPRGIDGFLCLPLMARGEAFGLLHLRWPVGGLPPLMTAVAELATSVAGTLSLSIWNMRLRATLSEQATKDPLTGLFNRAFMEASLSREIGRAERNHSPIAVIMADIDHFKVFNDTYGHAAGDLVLTKVAEVFRNLLRRGDIACRYGGEEFTLILPECQLANARDLALALTQGIRELRFSHAGTQLPAVTISMGVSAYPAAGMLPRELLKAADLALYRAKQNGRDAVVVAGASGPTAAATATPPAPTAGES